MTIDLSEGIEPDRWGDLPQHDRVLVGGHTVWTGPFDSPVLVAQPNRWGVIEGGFPSLPAVVEADPLVTAHLPLPEEVLGFVDRSHRPIPPPRAEARGEAAMALARRLASALRQVRGVKIAASPFGRTVPITTPLEPHDLAARCAVRGVVGARPIAGLAGGVALSVSDEHDRSTVDRIVQVMGEVVAG